MNDGPASHTPAPTPARFGAGIDDAVILPLVLLAVAARKLFDAALSLLIHILDYAFPVLLQVARFPLFTARIIGDGVAALLKGVARFLPMSGARRDAWRARVGQSWAWLRRKCSYHAFEEAVHHVFEGGMAWVFRKCRTLTPGGAVLVMTGAVLWFPISFAAATGLHAVLFAEAASLPPWMQLLHPVATIIAKSKLLVLPVYPAAWPQAKQHASVRTTLRFGRFVAALHVMRKTADRYGQTARAAADAGLALGRAAARVGLVALGQWLLAGVNGMAAWIGRAARAALRRTAQGAAALPLVGAVVARYAAHYDGADRRDPERLSQRVGGFFARWSIKFTAAYYEAKDNAPAQEGAAAPSAVSDRRTDT